MGDPTHVRGDWDSSSGLASCERVLGARREGNRQLVTVEVLTEPSPQLERKRTELVDDGWAVSVRQVGFTKHLDFEAPRGLDAAQALGRFRKAGRSGEEKKRPSAEWSRPTVL